MKFHAEIDNNDRKYYGTEINITNDDVGSATIYVWVNSLSKTGNPSEREYDVRGEDGKFYIKDDEDGELYEYEICDDHYETQVAYEISKAIVDTLNKLEIADEAP